MDEGVRAIATCVHSLSGITPALPVASGQSRGVAWNEQRRPLWIRKIKRPASEPFMFA